MHFGRSNIFGLGGWDHEYMDHNGAFRSHRHFFFAIHGNRIVAELFILDPDLPAGPYGAEPTHPTFHGG